MSFSQEIDVQRSTTYKKIKKLGEGTYGQAFLVEDMSDHRLYVSKKIKLDRLDVS